jgi:hypothetical protein
MVTAGRTRRAGGEGAKEFSGERDDFGAVRVDGGHHRVVRRADHPYLRSKRAEPSVGRLAAILRDSHGLRAVGNGGFCLLWG